MGPALKYNDIKIENQLMVRRPRPNNKKGCNIGLAHEPDKKKTENSLTELIRFPVEFCVLKFSSFG